MAIIYRPVMGTLRFLVRRISIITLYLHVPAFLMPRISYNNEDGIVKSDEKLSFKIYIRNNFYANMPEFF